MTLRLTIEHSPHPQDRREMHHPGGEFSIGRGAECSWQINDPDMYVSRKHCVITGEAGQFIVTDAKGASIEWLAEDGTKLQSGTLGDSTGGKVHRSLLRPCLSPSVQLRIVSGPVGKGTYLSLIHI